MENLLKKFGIEGLIAGVMLVFACICMWGCGDNIMTGRIEEVRRS